MVEVDIIQAFNQGLEHVISLVQNLSEQASSLENQNQNLSEQLSSLQNQNQGLSEQVNTLQNQNQGLSEQVSTLQNQNQNLSEQISSLQNQNQELESRVEKLEVQVQKTSKNSSKPPSTDGFKKTQSLRKPSGAKPGGQKGHKGSTLEQSETPDEVIIHDITSCLECGTSLEEVEPIKTIKRQVFDIPKQETVVTEHQVTVKICPNCGFKNQAQFPDNVTQPVQYGVNITTTAVYLNQYQFIPYKRMQELFMELFYLAISQGTLVNMVKRTYELLEPIESYIKSQLIVASVAHFDETGLYVIKSRWWLHSTSNSSYTFYFPHQKRGQEAIDAIGILPVFKGTAIHDCWASYFGYEDCTHAICNAHNLREGRAMIELHNQEWAKQMNQLLIDAKTFSESNAYPLSPVAIDEFNKRFERIIEQGYRENPLKEGEKNTDPVRFLNRLSKRQEEVLEFLHQRDVPFDNNQAERDIRMVKGKQKVSGTFRAEEGAKHFSRIRGVISTIKKQGKNVFESLSGVISGSKPMPID